MDKKIKSNIKKILPHLVILAVFFILSVIYFAPAVFDNKGLRQGDVVSYYGMGKDLKDYHDESGEFAYWSNSMFGGMPCNYTFPPSSENIFMRIGKVLRLGTVDYNFIIVWLYLIGFYVGMLCFGVGPWLSMLAAIAYAFGSYNIVIIEAGHVNKALVMATMLPVLGGIYLCYKRKFISGAIVTLLSTGLNVYWNHQQISYYLLLIIIPLAIVYFIYAIKSKEIKHFFVSSVVLILLASLAILPSSSMLIPNYDYAKESMRGGAVLEKNNEDNKSSGLEIDYAYQWSYGIGESLTILIPNLYGANSHYNIGNDSQTYEVLRQRRLQANQFCKYAPMYWGDQPFTSGPVYFGAIICMLFVLGLIICKGPERWWILVATIISFVLAWGRNLPIVNEFLFYNLPLYNKFRTPAMALVIANVTMVLMATLAIYKILKSDDKKQYLKPLYISSGINIGICLLLVLFGDMFFSFTALKDNQFPDWLQEAIILDRKEMMRDDALRSIGFIILAFVLLVVYIHKNFKSLYLVLILCFSILLDLWIVDKRFLNDDHFVAKKQASEIKPTACDLQILKDEDPNYRVLNLSTSTFNESNTSYFHKSIGGYSPAKLRRYQDIIDYYISGRNINMNVLNMLNTRYFIVPTEGGPQVQYNQNALGNVWFVNNVQWVKNANEEIEALKNIDPEKVVIINEEWREVLKLESEIIENDSMAAIYLSEYRNPGEIEYKYQSEKTRFAVFSEIYYKTWKAYVDGEEVPLVRVNYILRGAQLPAGEHTIVLKCYDELFDTSRSISLVSSFVVGLILLLLIVLGIYKCAKK